MRAFWRVVWGKTTFDKENTCTASHSHSPPARKPPPILATTQTHQANPSRHASKQSKEKLKPRLGLATLEETSYLAPINQYNTKKTARMKQTSMLMCLVPPVWSIF